MVSACWIITNYRKLKNMSIKTHPNLFNITRKILSVMTGRDSLINIFSSVKIPFTQHVALVVKHILVEYKEHQYPTDSWGINRLGDNEPTYYFLTQEWTFPFSSPITITQNGYSRYNLHHILISETIALFLQHMFPLIFVIGM